MKSWLIAIPILTIVLIAGGCTAPEGGKLGDPCTDKYDCLDVGACGGEDLPVCTNSKCACPTEADAMDLLNQAANQVFCSKGPHNDLWVGCSTQVNGFYYNSETEECEYYEGPGCSDLFETKMECEFACQ